MWWFWRSSGPNYDARGAENYNFTHCDVAVAEDNHEAGDYYGQPDDAAHYYYDCGSGIGRHGGDVWTVRRDGIYGTYAVRGGSGVHGLESVLLAMPACMSSECVREWVLLYSL